MEENYKMLQACRRVQAAILLIGTDKPNEQTNKYVVILKSFYL